MKQKIRDIGYKNDLDTKKKANNKNETISFVIDKGFLIRMFWLSPSMLN
jgi:hypothetical protein